MLRIGADEHPDLAIEGSAGNFPFAQKFYLPAMPGVNNAKKRKRETTSSKKVF